jgi:hypothetical protein
MKFFDELLPEWWEAINLDRLDLASCEDCMCGQLAGDLGRLDGDSHSPFGFVFAEFFNYQIEESIRHGFSLPFTEQEGDYDRDHELLIQNYEVLTQTWIEAIEARRAETK